MTQVSSSNIANGKIAWLGLDVPLELIDATGNQPWRLDADAGRPGPDADSYAEGGGHPLIHALAAELFARRHLGLRQLVIAPPPVAHAALFHFYNSLPADQRTGLQVHLLQLLHRDDAWAQGRNRAALRALGVALDIDDAKLAAAITRRNAMRHLLIRIEALRRAPGPRVSGSEMLALYGEIDNLICPRSAANLQTLIQDKQNAVPLPGRRVIICGSSAADAAIYSCLEEQGFHIVAEDHDRGLYAAGPLVAEGGDPYAALAEAYAGRVAVAAGWSIIAATTAMIDLVRATTAEAVLFNIPAFDHPDAWDFPARRAALEQCGIKWALLPPYAYRNPEPAALQAAQTLHSLLSAEVA